MVSQEREQQRTAEQSEEGRRFVEETVEAVTLVLGERVQQRTAEHHENPLCEETIELLRQIMSKRGQQQTVEQIVDVFGRHLRGGDVGPTCANASTDR